VCALGVDYGKAFDIASHLKNSVFFPAICLKVFKSAVNMLLMLYYITHQQNAEVKFNFCDTKFAFPPQGGYKGLSQAPADLVTQSITTGMYWITFLLLFLYNATKNFLRISPKCTKSPKA
jgi:hypothetical protein